MRLASCMLACWLKLCVLSCSCTLWSRSAGWLLGVLWELSILLSRAVQARCGLGRRVGCQASSGSCHFFEHSCSGTLWSRSAGWLLDVRWKLSMCFEQSFAGMWWLACLEGCLLRQRHALVVVMFEQCFQACGGLRGWRELPEWGHTKCPHMLGLNLAT